MSDQVRLIVGGREFAGWTGVTISMAVDQVADAFSVSAPFDPDSAEIRAAFLPFDYTSVQLYIDDDILLTGRVDKIDAGDESGRKLTVTGRALPGQLVDCSIDGPLEYTGLTLAAIARQLCRPFGITVRADNDTAAIESARAEYGQTVAEFLNSLAGPRNMLLNSSFDGKLVISAGSRYSSAPVVAALAEGKAPLLTVAASFDGTKRFSLYKYATQFGGVPDISGSVQDTRIPIYRPILTVAEDADADFRATAGRMRVRAYSEAIGVNVKINGWRRPDGLRWADRQIVTLIAPGAMLYTETKYLVASVAYKMDESGLFTDLRLVLPETYSGSAPGATPWA